MSFHQDSFHQVKSRKQVQEYLEEIEVDYEKDIADEKETIIMEIQIETLRWVLGLKT